MKRIRSLIAPVIFLMIGGVAVWVSGKFLDVKAVGSWIQTQIVPLLPWFGQDATGESGYVAVYLTGGKVYFGKLHDVRSPSPSLTDVFFLNVREQSQPVVPESPDEAESATVESAQQLDYELVKLTDQLQKPSDKLILSRDQILFWEPLRPDSRVVQAIRKYHEQKPN